MAMRFPAYAPAVPATMAPSRPMTGADSAAVRPPPGLEAITPRYPAPGVWFAKGRQEPQMQSMPPQQPPQASIESRMAVTDLLLTLMANVNAGKQMKEPTTNQGLADSFLHRAPHGSMAPPAEVGKYGLPMFDAVKHYAACAPPTCSTCGMLPANDPSLTASWASERSFSEESESDTQGPTLMVRNIPGAYTQEALLREWPIDGTWDLLYVPWNTNAGCNLGYAFVNFTSKVHAAAFMAKWQDQRLARFPAEEGLDIKPADVQGFQANIAQLKKRRVNRIKIRQCLPVIVQNGRRVELKNL